MTESSASPSPHPKRPFRRFFIWMVLGGISLLFLGLVLLIGLTLPDLRREVTPPEISGPQRVVPSSDSSKNASFPTSGTLSVSGDTSGTSGSLNLDDFPHLSPKMRELAQVWLDRCEETSQALDAITDPALRAQALGYLKTRKIRGFLNLPLEWRTCPYKEALQHVIGDYRVDRFYGRDNPNNLPLFYPQCPEFDKALKKELNCFVRASARLSLELSMFYKHWGNTTQLCVPMTLTERVSPIQENLHNETWEEEVYCWRQMGPKGMLGLTARSYQRALMKVANDSRSPLVQKLYAAGGIMALTMTGEPEEGEPSGTDGN
jgi:hypothetical protein